MKMKNRENAFLKYWPWLLPAGAVIAFGNIWNAAGFLDGILGRFRLPVGVVGSCDADCKLCRETKKIVFLSFRSIAIIKSRN